MKRRGIFLFQLLSLFAVCIPTVYGDGIPEVTVCDVVHLNGIQLEDLVRVTGICSIETGRLGPFTTVLEEYEGLLPCGLVCYDTEELFQVKRGQCASVCGTVKEYYGVIELFVTPEMHFDVWDCAWQYPDPYRMVPESPLDQLVNCMVVIEGVTVTDISDPLGLLVVDRYDQEWHLIFRNGLPGTTFCSITGLLDYSFDEYRIRPLNDSAFDTREFNDCPWLGTACDSVEIHPFINTPESGWHHCGDPFRFSVTWTNLCHNRQIIQMIAMDIAGGFWFWPSWNPEIDFEVADLLECRSDWDMILDFVCPEGSFEINGRFWLLALDPVIGAPVSDLVQVPFQLNGNMPGN
ncbi:hypothetical protein JW979_01520 [bacterium]|nr:hypothetical protein [candidate division CSSED10-310 bacterium]